MNLPERLGPTKVYSIFERPKPPHDTNHMVALKEDSHEPIYISDNESCAEEVTPYQRRAVQHLFSVSSSNTLSRHGSTSDASAKEPQRKLRPGRSSTSATASIKPVYSIFAQKQSIQFKAVANLSGQAAPFPDQENQHVHGLHPRVVFSHRSLYSTRLNRGNKLPREQTDSDNALAGLCSPQTIFHSPTQGSALMDGDINAYIDTIPRSDRALHSISRILQYVEDNHELNTSTNVTYDRWTDKWSPKRAEEVIGNESRALYLRDWLLALRLQNDVQDIRHSSQSTTAGKSRKRKLTRKKARVVRHVKKQRRGSNVSIDDFVASDGSTDFEEEPLTAPSSDFDELAFSDGAHSESNENFAESSRGSSPLTGLSEDERPMAPKPPPRRFGRHLMNTILLTGPSGSGKTASVYACAEELGYEVFEVYPGMGERNGASLNKLVGDVGKNHVVTMKRRRSPEARQNFFQRKAPRKAINGIRRVPDSSDVESMPDELDIIAQSEPEEEPVQPTITQSLILVEEVDILFQTDSNFWPGLINIIKECRRPVILTCNGLSIPVAEGGFTY
jgi:dephospho-CoA kinase